MPKRIRPPSRKTWWLKYQRTNNGRARTLLYNAKTRAKQLGVCCTLNLTFVLEKLARGVCEVTGIALEFENGTRRQHPWAPSLDRIDPKGAYSPTNTRMVCWLYNRARGLYSDETVLRMAQALVLKRS